MPLNQITQPKLIHPFLSFILSLSIYLSIYQPLLFEGSLEGI